MSYAKLIDRQLTLAFNKVKDLAVDAVILKRTDSDFNFAVGSTGGSVVRIPVKLIVVKKKKTSQDVNTEQQQVMFRAQEVIDVTSADKLDIGGVIWTFNNKLTSNGHTTVAEVSREI